MMPDRAWPTWLLPGRRALTDDGDLFLTAEQAHLLCAMAGVATLPGLGPLPIEILGEPDERLCVDAAIRSLTARGILTFCPRPAIADAEVHAILCDHARARALLALTITARPRTRRVLWSVMPTSIVEWTAVTPTDYRMHRHEPDELALRIAAVAGLDASGDDREDEPLTLTREEWEQQELAGSVLELDCSRRDGARLETGVVVAAARPDGGWWTVDEPEDGWIELMPMGEGALVRRLVAEVPAGLSTLEPLLAELMI